MSGMLPRLFFKYFRDTSFVLEEEGDITAFLIGFLSQSTPEEAYIHFVGVHPEYRKKGYGRTLYRHFFDKVTEKGCRRVYCITSPVNQVSVAYHTRLGFQMMEGDFKIDGTPVYQNYDGPGEDRVLFVKELHEGDNYCKQETPVP